MFSWAASSKFVSSSIPSWQILTAHAQPFRGARDLAFCLKVPLDSLLVWASSEGSGETARMRRLAWTFAARICDKNQIRLTRSSYRRLRGSKFALICQNLHLDVTLRKICLGEYHSSSNIRNNRIPLHMPYTKIVRNIYFAGRGVRAASHFPYTLTGFDYGTSLISSVIVLIDDHSWWLSMLTTVCTGAHSFCDTYILFPIPVNYLK